MKSLVLIAALAASQAAAMDLKSHDMAEGAMLSAQQVYSDCNGDNVSPQLAWSAAPAGTKSFAITLYDPDSHPNGWWHWVLFDVPPDVTGLTRGASGSPSQLPPGAMQGQNDFQQTGYGGACPPPGSGVHHYRFTLWALDTAALPFNDNTTGNDVEPFLKKHALAQATLTPVYQR